MQSQFFNCKSTAEMILLCQMSCKKISPKVFFIKVKHKNILNSEPNCRKSIVWKAVYFNPLSEIKDP